MTTASLAVSLDLRENNETSDGTQWLQLIAFGSVAELLAKERGGAMLNIHGRCQLSRYETRDGETREGLTVIIDSMISARTTRPGGGKRKDAEVKNGAQASMEQPPFTDEQARYARA